MSTKFTIITKDQYGEEVSQTVEASFMNTLDSTIVFHEGNMYKPELVVSLPYFISATKLTNIKETNV